jgi:tetratricopeptide (TPR) repeat protein
MTLNSLYESLSQELKSKLALAENALCEGKSALASSYIKELIESKRPRTPIEKVLYEYHLDYLRATLCIIQASSYIANPIDCYKNLMKYQSNAICSKRIAELYQYLACLMTKLKMIPAAVELLESAGALISKHVVADDIEHINSICRNLMELSESGLALTYLIQYIKAFTYNSKIEQTITLAKICLSRRFDSKAPLLVSELHMAVETIILSGNYYMRKDRADLAKLHYETAIDLFKMHSNCPDIGTQHAEYAKIKKLFVLTGKKLIEKSETMALKEASDSLRSTSNEPIAASAVNPSIVKSLKTYSASSKSDKTAFNDASKSTSFYAKYITDSFTNSVTGRKRGRNEFSAKTSDSESSIKHVTMV